ncbi:hypothetical protein [Vagococcus intermedius]|uniref:Uncharacterized protein n=1 Tax=Vagococcus intermedius TaxID=2991418 RepID=A0AAF0I8I3_9ENTE|nr:hypothetical protein [Vagococcus intermedius]WEG74415.1 hypothetical protein OL234_10655 [Vagococcus intermedius]WEG76535.1 hypothetical protein OL235_10825 [Vagococcus intermedius]
MKKVDIKEITQTLLANINGINKASSSYPTSWQIFPSAIHKTSSKPHFIDFEGNELQSEWNITIELYSDKTLTDITDHVIQRFSNIGFNLSKKDANTAEMKRVILEAVAIVDNNSKIVYQK